MTDHRLRGPEEAARRWDRVFEALSAEPRRKLVDALMDVPDGGSVALPDAAAGSTTEADPADLEVQLLHRHLPMLSEAGYVEWERAPFRAARAPRFVELEAVLGGLYANASEVPDHLVEGYRPLERERERLQR